MVELSLDEKKEIILDIMKDVDRFCRENNIRYSISSGTLLGAVRHGGFIPWDDDADIFMLREDFDRFVKIYKSERFHLLYNIRNDDEFLATGYAKISDPRTIILNTKTVTNYGVYIDVFPLDYVPADEKERRNYMHSIMSTHNRLHHRQKKDLWSIIKAHRHSMDWWWNRLETLVHCDKYKDSPLVAHILGAMNYRTVIDKSRFDSLKEIDFEDTKLMAFSDTHSYLTMVFGEDYMTPKKWAHNYKVYWK